MNRFRTSSPPGDWRSFRFTHAETGVTYCLGELYLIQETVGVLFLDIQYNADGSKADAEITLGDEGVLVYHIEKMMLDKETGTGSAFLPGDKVFWSGVQGASVTNTWQSGYYWIGIATEPASDTATQVEVDLKGDKATLTDPI